MEKLSITLTEQMVDHVQAQVKSGQYASTSEYVRDALREKMALDEELGMMKERFERAKAQAQSDELLDHESVFKRLEARIENMSGA